MNGSFPLLKDLRDRAFQGLRTSDNDVYVLRADGPSKKGLMPVLSRGTQEVHHIEATLLKPLLSGEDIRAFSLAHRDQWILFPYDLSDSEPARLSEKKLRSEYPEAWNYLKACENRLHARERGRMDRAVWWAYIYPKNLDQFEQPKIMLPDYKDSPAAGLDVDGRFYLKEGLAYGLENSVRQDRPG
jgi:adenine-specific DNA-methyltransferase